MSLESGHKAIHDTLLDYVRQHDKVQEEPFFLLRVCSIYDFCGIRYVLKIENEADGEYVSRVSVRSVWPLELKIDTHSVSRSFQNSCPSSLSVSANDDESISVQWRLMNGQYLVEPHTHRTMDVINWISSIRYISMPTWGLKFVVPTVLCACSRFNSLLSAIVLHPEGPGASMLNEPSKYAMRKFQLRCRYLALSLRVRVSIDMCLHTYDLARPQQHTIHSTLAVVTVPSKEGMDFIIPLSFDERTEDAYAQDVLAALTEGSDNNERKCTHLSREVRIRSFGYLLSQLTAILSQGSEWD
jgi:hypothetical protein